MKILFSEKHFKPETYQALAISYTKIKSVQKTVPQKNRSTILETQFKPKTKLWLAWISITLIILKCLNFKLNSLECQAYFEDFKGQLISKGLFDILEFFQKRTNKFVHSTVRQKKPESVCLFFGRIVSFKKPFWLCLTFTRPNFPLTFFTMLEYLDLKFFDQYKENFV